MRKITMLSMEGVANFIKRIIMPKRKTLKSIQDEYTDKLHRIKERCEERHNAMVLKVADLEAEIEKLKG